MEMPVLEAIRTLRSMRRLKPDSVEPHKIHLILEAAGKAPSGGNSQPWEFIVITDPSVKKQLLKVPDYVKPGILVYVGYPATRFSEPKRLPIETFIHKDGW